MRKPWLRWLRRIAIALAVAVAALAPLLWAIYALFEMLVRPWLQSMNLGAALAAVDAATIIGAEAIIAAEALLALLLGIWWLWWRLPQRQVAQLTIQISDPKARADAEDNFRKTVGQALGGAVVLIGAGAAYLQFTQQQQAARDLLISNQVAKGFEQLGGDKVAMRLGGIYGLEGVMQNSAQYQRPVFEALCAFVRDSTIGKAVGKVPAADIQAALTVIERRRTLGPWVVDLVQASIPGADLSGADLSRVDLRVANLRNARLDTAQLAGAHLSGADLRSVDLSSVDLRYANLGGADLRGAYLSSALLGDADLSDADLDNVRALTQTQLDQACGTNAKNLPPGLTLKPCPPPPAPATPAGH